MECSLFQLAVLYCGQGEHAPRRTFLQENRTLYLLALPSHPCYLQHSRNAFSEAVPVFLSYPFALQSGR